LNFEWNHSLFLPFDHLTDTETWRISGSHAFWPWLETLELHLQLYLIHPIDTKISQPP
jgi:hypothetical protein